VNTLPINPVGSLVFGGTSYPVAYNYAQVILNSSSIVPYGNATVEEPAELIGNGLACTAIYPQAIGIESGIASCFPSSAIYQPYPVPIANVDLDIQGFMTFTFQPSQSGEETYTATFAQVPEPEIGLLLIPMFTLVVWWSKRKGLKGLRLSAR
jgi:hypothetical protein